MMVKVCGITRREDAEAAVDAGASALGFIFYKPSPRYVTPEKARELGAGLDIWKVGVFVDESPATIEEVVRSAKLDIAQIYGASLPQGLRIWQAVRVSGALPRTAFSGEALFLDSSANGISFDWNVARAAAEKVVIAGGLDASNVRDAIRIAQPWGVDASSRLESSPGIKDHEKVRQFVQAAREIA